MKIALDLRGLHSGKISGVENYIVNILERLLRMDRDNHYLLFENAQKLKNFSQLRFVNSEVVQRRVPNKLFNLSLRLLNRPKFEQFFGEFDALFMPNFNFFSIRPAAKLVVTVHDLSPIVTPEYYNLKRQLWHRLVTMGKTLKRADKIIAVSEYTKADIVRLFNIPQEKITVVYPGIDRTLFAPHISVARLREVRNIYGLPGEYVLFLNTVEPRKNLVNFIKAYEKIQRPISMVIGGKKGWKYRKIFSAMENSPKRRNIKYLGYVPEEHKPALIRLARAAAFPSFYEGFGFPALEALSVGVPVLTSNVTSLPETVENAAVMVNPHDIDDMASGLEAILSDEKLRESLIARGLEHAKKFNWDDSAAKILAVFNSL
jgi:glycosyltransferase involved in cell wall biosynthesis